MAMRTIGWTIGLLMLSTGALMILAIYLLAGRSGKLDSDRGGGHQSVRSPTAARSERLESHESAKIPRGEPDMDPTKEASLSGHLGGPDAAPRPANLHVAIDGPEDVRLADATVVCERLDGRVILAKRVSRLRQFELKVPHSIEFVVGLRAPIVTSDQLHVPRLLPGEHRMVRLRIRRYGTPFWGRVVDKETGQSIHGAHVEFADTNVANYCLTTDEAGYFCGSLHDNSLGTEISISSDGYESVSVSVAVNSTSRAEPRVITLSRGAALSGRVLDQNGRPCESVNVNLECDNREKTSLGFGFWHSGAETHTDQEGRFRLEKLSPDRPFTITFVSNESNGESKVLAVERPRALAPGEHRQMILRLQPRGALHGRVLDQAGAPVADAGIVLLGIHPASRGRFRHYDYTEGLAQVCDVVDRATTDDSGRFAFDDVPPGHWFIMLEVDSSVEAPRALAVDIPSGAKTTVTFQVYRGLAITGRVVDSTGASPIEGMVWARPVRGAPESWDDASVSEDCKWAVCEKNGDFNLSPLSPGYYWVMATKVGLNSIRKVSIPKRVCAGVENLNLRLGLAGGLRGETIDAVSNHGVACIVIAIRRGGKTHRCFSNPKFEFKTLVPGTYDLYAWSDDGRVGFLSDVCVVPEHPTKASALRVNRGTVLEVTLSGSDRRFACSVRPGSIHSEIPLGGHLIANGLPLSVVIPAGFVEIFLYDADTVASKQVARRLVQVSIGQRVRVDFSIERE